MSLTYPVAQAGLELYITLIGYDALGRILKSSLKIALQAP